MKTTLRLGLLAVVATSFILMPSAADKVYRPDPWITLKTKIALATETDVSAHQVNVDTVDGRVTLHGKVDSAAEKTRAEEIAKKIEGVTTVRNLLQAVPPEKRPATDVKDADIKKAVEDVLKSDPMLKNSNITVQSVNNGVVLLAGKAASMSDHLRAIQDARRVPGSRRVASEVESPDRLSDREVWEDTGTGTATGTTTTPARSASQTVSDAWVTTATKMRLMASPTTPALDINVDTENGVVTLFGIVSSEESKKEAEAQARQVSGVKEVVNALQVVPKAEQEAVRAKDDQIKKSVEEAMERHKELGNVDVEVQGGVVRLTGTVPSQSDRLRASVVVRSTRGARAVQNELRVEQAPVARDSK